MAWKFPTRIAFRFTCAYLILYYLPDFLTRPIDRLVTAHILHWSVASFSRQPTGSGDTTLDYIHLFSVVILAAAIAVIWSVADRKREEYRILHAWLRLIMRYVLASILFGYGLAKVFPTQFVPPTLSRLIQPYGDFSPMGVLWEFMGSSMAYTIFCGAMETLAATLLVFRRTSTLGALVAAGVLLNVVMLNFCYDVPVKLYSLNLLLTALFLAAPDLGRLVDFLVLNRAAKPVTASGPVFQVRAMRITGVAVKLLFIGMIVTRGVFSYRDYQTRDSDPPRPPLYGLYEVESFARNGREVPPLATDSTRWKTVVVQFAAFMRVKMMDDSSQSIQAQVDPAGSILRLMGAYPLSYAKPDADHLVLQGKLLNDSVRIEMRRIDESKFLLVNRGFHWINETPFNR